MCDFEVFSLTANGKAGISLYVGDMVFPTCRKKLNLLLIAVRRNSVALTLPRPPVPNLGAPSPRGVEGVGPKFCKGALHHDVHQLLSTE